MIKTIGITGGIGAGKSVVSRALRLRGYRVYDCDFEAKRLMDNSAQLKEDISRRFGAECLLADGSLHRPAIAAHLFGDAAKRDWLNSIVHAMVRADIAAWLGSLEEEGVEVAFIESAILRSSRLDAVCSEIWLVDAPEEVRISRVQKRNGMKAELVRQRIEAQMEEYSDFGNLSMRRIINDGSIPLLPQIEIE